MTIVFLITSAAATHDVSTANYSASERMRLAATTGTLDIIIANASLSESALAVFVKNNEPFPVLGNSVVAEIVMENAAGEEFPKGSDVRVSRFSTSRFDLGASESKNLSFKLDFPRRLGFGAYRLDLYLLVQGSSLGDRIDRRVPNYFRRIGANRLGEKRTEVYMARTTLCTKTPFPLLSAGVGTGGQYCANATKPFYALPSSRINVTLGGLAGESAEDLSLSVELYAGDAKVSGGTYKLVSNPNESIDFGIAISTPQAARDLELVVTAYDKQGEQSFLRVPIYVAGAPPQILAIVTDKLNYSRAEKGTLAILVGKPRQDAGERYYLEALLHGKDETPRLGPLWLAMGTKAGGASAYWPFFAPEELSSYAVEARLTTVTGSVVNSRTLQVVPEDYRPGQPAQAGDYLLPVLLVAFAVVFVTIPYASKWKKGRKKIQAAAADGGGIEKNEKSQQEQADDKRPEKTADQNMPASEKTP